MTQWVEALCHKQEVPGSFLIGSLEISMWPIPFVCIL